MASLASKEARKIKIAEKREKKRLKIEVERRGVVKEGFYESHLSRRQLDSRAPPRNRRNGWG
jgi:hypothetical protein